MDEITLTDLVNNEDTQGIGDFFLNQGLDLPQIATQFGETSREFELYERYLAEITFESRTTPHYITPQHEIGPSITKKNLDNWIRDFCNQNELKLPKGFGKKNKKQLWGMYLGMAEKYTFTPEETFKKSQPVEDGFKIRGYKHAEQILTHSTGELALRNLIYDVTRDGNLANNLDYRGLRHQYHRIVGVAKKMLRVKS
jgi:hypothetical protein